MKHNIIGSVLTLSGNFTDNEISLITKAESLIKWDELPPTLDTYIF